MLNKKIVEKISNIKDIFKISVLSAKSGVDKHTISEILSGNTKNPGVHTIAKIADALECSIDELMEGDAYSDKELKLELAKSCIATIVDLMYQRQLKMGLDKFAYILTEVYISCLDKNLIIVDKKLVDQIITNAIEQEI